MRRRIHGLDSLTVLCLLTVLPLASTAQESASYVMERVSATAGAQTAVSTSFTTTVLIGQSSPSGSASDPACR